MRLTKAQSRRLSEIADYRPSAEWPHAPFWKSSRTDQSLISRGLIERADITKTLGGPSGAATGLTATWHGCRLTDAGRAIAALSQSKGDE